MKDFFLAIFSTFSISVVLYGTLGTVIGIVFGAIPGLNGSMGIVLSLPLIYHMTPADSFAMLLGIYCGSMFGGSITAILIKTPGTAAAAATVLDGHTMAMNGEPKKAIQSACASSFVGGIFSCIVLTLVAPQLAKVALTFSSAEYFMLGILGISIVASLAADNLAKGFFAALFGLLISTVGMDMYSGVFRFTFGNYQLSSGLNTVPTLIGIFATAEVFTQLEKRGKMDSNKDMQYSGNDKGLTVKEFWSYKWALLRSSIIGTVVGIIPATGPAIASWLSYNQGKTFSKTPEKFGTGCVEGIFCCEAANNAVTGGALVPLMTLGIPGDTITAILMGAFMVQGMSPGPLLFRDNPQVVSNIYFDLLLANILMFILGMLAVKLFVQILKVPPIILLPIVLMFCMTGSYASGNRLFDLYTTIILGLVSYFFRKINIPAPPILLGMLLGSTIENNYVRALQTSKNGALIFFTRPISLCLFIVTILFLAIPYIQKYLNKRKEKAKQE